MTNIDRIKCIKHCINDMINNLKTLNNNSLRWIEKKEIAEDISYSASDAIDFISYFIDFNANDHDKTYIYKSYAEILDASINASNMCKCKKNISEFQQNVAKCSENTRKALVYFENHLKNMGT